MKNLSLIFASIFFMMAVSCSINSVKIDQTLSKEEAQAVVNTEKSLPRSAKIESYEVVKLKLPLSLLESEYKSYRDQVNKARIDYRTNMTRGLKQVAEKNIETLINIQNAIVEKSGSIESSSPEYIFVLANVKERERKDGKLSGYIAVYDQTNLEQVDLIQITTPLYNNAVMVTEALDGTLADPNQDIQNIKSSNPIVNFILKSNPK